MIDFVISLGGAFFSSVFWSTYMMPVLAVGMLVFAVVIFLGLVHWR